MRKHLEANRKDKVGGAGRVLRGGGGVPAVRLRAALKSGDIEGHAAIGC
jgi:hypothetical protein